MLLPLVAAAALCAYSELAITPQIDAIRPLVFGPQGTPELAARFQQLHRVSVVIFVSVGVSTLVLLAAHVRADCASTRGIRPSPEPASAGPRKFDEKSPKNRRGLHNAGVCFRGF